MGDGTVYWLLGDRSYGGAIQDALFLIVHALRGQSDRQHIAPERKDLASVRSENSFLIFYPVSKK